MGDFIVFKLASSSLNSHVAIADPPMLAPRGKKLGPTLWWSNVCRRHSKLTLHCWCIQLFCNGFDINSFPGKSSINLSSSPWASGGLTPLPGHFLLPSGTSGILTALLNLLFCLSLFLSLFLFSFPSSLLFLSLKTLSFFCN